MVVPHILVFVVHHFFTCQWSLQNLFRYQPMEVSATLSLGVRRLTSPGLELRAAYLTTLKASFALMLRISVKAIGCTFAGAVFLMLKVLLEELSALSTSDGNFNSTVWAEPLLGLTEV